MRFGFTCTSPSQDSGASAARDDPNDPTSVNVASQVAVFIGVPPYHVGGDYIVRLRAASSGPPKCATRASRRAIAGSLMSTTVTAGRSLPAGRWVMVAFCGIPIDDPGEVQMINVFPAPNSRDPSFCAMAPRGSQGYSTRA